MVLMSSSLMNFLRRAYYWWITPRSCRSERVKQQLQNSRNQKNQHNPSVYGLRRNASWNTGERNPNEFPRIPERVGARWETSTRRQKGFLRRWPPSRSIRASNVGQGRRGESHGRSRDQEERGQHANFCGKIASRTHATDNETREFRSILAPSLGLRPYRTGRFVERTRRAWKGRLSLRVTMERRMNNAFAFA